MSRPTIKDVAAEAGVSAQAVSLVIHDRPGVSNATRNQIQQVIQKLNYTPRTWAQAMRGAGTRTLGFVYAGTRQGRLSASGYLEEILNGALAAANHRGYHLLLYSLQGGSDAKQLQDLEQQSRVDGLVTVVSDISEPHLDMLESLTLPLVEVQRQSASACTVCADDRGGIRAAVSYLVRRGHQRIAYLSRPFSTYASEERYAGYLEGLGAHGLEPNEAFIRYAEHGQTDSIIFSERHGEPHEIAQGLELTLELLGQREPPSALVCFDDLLAVGALRAARMRRKRVPDDLAVIGYNNFSIAAAVDPPLTTVEFPAHELGINAAGMLIDLLENRPPAQRHNVLPVKLVVRSTA